MQTFVADAGADDLGQLKRHFRDGTGTSAPARPAGVDGQGGTRDVPPHRQSARFTARRRAASAAWAPSQEEQEAPSLALQRRTSSLPDLVGGLQGRQRQRRRASGRAGARIRPRRGRPRRSTATLTASQEDDDQVAIGAGMTQADIRRPARLLQMRSRTARRPGAVTARRGDERARGRRRGRPGTSPSCP